MLSLALRFFGFTPAPPRRKPSARRVAPAIAPAPAPVALSAEERARRNRETAERLRPDPNARFAADVALVVRTFDHHSSQPSPEELHLALCRLGEVGEYVRAVYVGGGRLATLPLSQQGDRARTKAYREHVTSLVRTDLDRWDTGATAADRAIAEAKRFGDPAPQPIALPEDIRAKINARAVERIKRLAEQAARRAGGGGGGGGGGAASPPAAPPAAPAAGPTGGPDDDTPEGSAPPAGPRR